MRPNPSPGNQSSDHVSGEESWLSDVTEGEVYSLPYLSKAKQKASRCAVGKQRGGKTRVVR